MFDRSEEVYVYLSELDELTYSDRRYISSMRSSMSNFFGIGHVGSIA